MLPTRRLLRSVIAPGSGSTRRSKRRPLRKVARPGEVERAQREDNAAVRTHEEDPLLLCDGPPALVAGPRNRDEHAEAPDALKVSSASVVHAHTTRCSQHQVVSAWASPQLDHARRHTRLERDDAPAGEDGEHGSR